MLAYSVFSLRLSEDVPSQSDSVHLISLYLTVCMFFSLSAMTWFAIVNKLREKKRLPYWLRWLALDYLSWIVCATSMHRKAVRLMKQDTSMTSPITPSTPVHIPLQATTSGQTNHPIEYSNSYYFDREALGTGISVKVSLMSCKSSRTASAVEPSTMTLVPGDDSSISRSQSPSTVWIRRRLGNIPTSPSCNGPLSGKRPSKNVTQSALTRLLHEESPNKNRESLYAIHIYNRLVFFMFLFFVIAINGYTWFFYSRSMKSKLYDERAMWTCFDESILEVVNCTGLRV